MASSSLAGVAVDSQDLFVSGTGGYHTYRIPAVARMPDGSLFAFAEGRVNSNSDSGNIDIVMRRSSDNGLTWSPMTVAFNMGFNTAGNPTPIVNANTGALHLMFSRNNQAAFVAQFNFGTNQFNAATDITTVVQSLNVPFTINRLGPGPTAGIQLDNGRLVAPVWVNETSGVDSKYRSAVLYSDNGGATWQAGGVVPVANPVLGSNESAVAQLADGSLYMSIRTNGGTPSRGFSTSSDGGLTWSTVQLQPQIDSDMAAVKGSLLALDYPNDALLLAAPEGPARNNMAIWLNLVQASAWSKIDNIASGPAGYPELTLLNGNMVGLLYENGTSDYRERITWTRLDVSSVPVPEPASWIVIAIGVILVGLKYQLR
jgi:sialidase-1